MSRAPAASAVDVRTRGNSSPTAHQAATIGEMAALAVEEVLPLARPPFPRWREYVRQCVFILHAPFRALGGAVAVHAFGAPGLEGGGFSSFEDRRNHVGVQGVADLWAGSAVICRECCMRGICKLWFGTAQL